MWVPLPWLLSIHQVRELVIHARPPRILGLEIPPSRSPALTEMIE
jgi:hypothetical protein